MIIIAILLGIVACKEAPKEAQSTDYIQQGKEITKATFEALSSKLTEQMKLGGPAKAVPFCNVEAMPLTDSMAAKYMVTIKRTSDKLRNPKNKATSRELEIISQYQKSKANGDVLKPMVEKDSEEVAHFYAPITTNAKCLKCHGVVGEMTMAKTDSIIKSLYPEDIATGYGDEQVRGIWSITFNK